MIGTVPIYDAVVYYHKPLKQITSGEWIDIVRMHARDGVDFMTIHCGINKETAHKFKKNKRLTNIVSRGGSIIFAWMEMTGEEKNGKSENKVCAEPHRPDACGKFKDRALHISDRQA